MVKCSVPLIARPFTVVNVPDTAGAVRMVNFWPTVGVKDPKAMFSVPLSVAPCVTLS